jgi:hypothetical protein
MNKPNVAQKTSPRSLRLSKETIKALNVQSGVQAGGRKLYLTVRNCPSWTDCPPGRRLRRTLAVHAAPADARREPHFGAAIGGTLNVSHAGVWFDSVAG